ncbi:L-serine ammonia-lyase [Mycobacterium aquaticum]|jgi:L-serine dehydratase|uniref:L-serine dehydratase n=1 Tax=Mycobacterium aquaticum TaxID=1927124 RepID=A0A1X0BA64_9MYCO|nr:L-serine ammonia-lyase [Mycobacterium aquaticum]ORA39227.1 L-serine ammonia-lyase [Mycobacterium aquaticum]
MAVSVFDLFSVGIGPSSSHTVGPMRAARTFADSLGSDELLSDTASVSVELFGSLGATGMGHGSDVAVLLGLSGAAPELIDPDRVDDEIHTIRQDRQLRLAGTRSIPFDESIHLIMHRNQTLPYHPNGMRFRAFDANAETLCTRTYYSIGGGFIVEDGSESRDAAADTAVTYPFRTAAELLAHCAATGSSIGDIMLSNEMAWRSVSDVHSGLLHIWNVMQQCVSRGCEREGMLPGALKVPRRAAELYRRLTSEHFGTDPLRVMDWVNLFALAVNEENASGGRVVTAPTNGAAGIVPAVLHYYARFIPGASNDGIIEFLLTAGAIGVIYKESASISGAEVGCQGEVGSASSMAAGALCAVLGGNPAQVENAAEIAMEHNLGLTCDPVGGLVQIPCIERNAMGAVKAINAARMALRGNGCHRVSLDTVIKTMRDTGADMHVKYKETARGGLAVNVVEC